MKVCRCVFLIFVVFLASACSNKQLGTIGVSGLYDDFERSVIVSSRNFSNNEARGLKAFFRSSISKSNPDVFATSIYIQTTSVGWRFWNELRYIKEGELINIDLNRVHSNVSCNQYGCTHYEDFVGILPIEDIRYFSQKNEGIDLRLNSRRVGSFDFKMKPAEAAAFIGEIERTVELLN